MSSDYKDDGTNILLDANENAYGPGLGSHLLGDASINGKHNGVLSGHSNQPVIDLLGLNRYPDPYVLYHHKSVSNC